MHAHRHAQTDIRAHNCTAQHGSGTALQQKVPSTGGAFGSSAGSALNCTHGARRSASGAKTSSTVVVPIGPSPMPPRSTRARSSAAQLRTPTAHACGAVAGMNVISCLVRPSQNKTRAGQGDRGKRLARGIRPHRQAAPHCFTLVKPFQRSRLRFILAGPGASGGWLLALRCLFLRLALGLES